MEEGTGFVPNYTSCTDLYFPQTTLKYIHYRLLGIGRETGDKHDHEQCRQGIPAHVSSGITYSLREGCATQLLENIQLPPGFIEQKHV